MNTAKFPTAVAAEIDLLTTKDAAISTLTADMTAGATSFTVADGSKFCGKSVVTIDSEKILIDTVATNTLNVATSGRGFGGTSAATHSTGAYVRGNYTSDHHNQLAAEVNAIETALGASLVNVVKSTIAADVSGNGKKISNLGDVSIGVATPTQRLDVTGSSSPAVAIHDSGSIAVGKGGELLLQHINASGTRTTYASVKGYANNGSAGAEVGSLLLKTMSAGALATQMTLNSAGIVTPNIPVYANNAAAAGAGLPVGGWYRTGGDPDHLCIVHA